MAKSKSARPHKIWRWRGILGDESPRTRGVVWFLLLLVSASMTFMQLGFVGVGDEGGYVAYVLALLGPILLGALCLGWRVGALTGFVSGGVLLLHARLQPLDLYERYFVSPLNSLVLYTCVGLLLGLLLAVALRNDPQGVRRKIYLVVVCALVALVISVAFVVNAIIDITLAAIREASEATLELPRDSIMALTGMGSITLQVVLDFVLMLVLSLVTDREVRRIQALRDHLSVRTIFRAQLLVVVLVVLLVVESGSFTAITMGAKVSASDHMANEIDFIMGQIDDGDDSVQRVIGGYDLTDGTVVVFKDNVVLCSDNPSYAPGSTADDAFGLGRGDLLAAVAASGEMRPMVYGTHSASETSAGDDSLFENVELGYMRVLRRDGYTVMMAMPSSMVFANRKATIGWTFFALLVLLFLIYVVAAWLLNRVVVSPIDRTNASLAKICEGNLNERVKETDSVEFSSLSEGINSTVEALKRLIGEAEARMERDLATAKAIQESALPRTFPPFPEVEAFDIFASMNAAKEVGGDFYDFFLVDDHTLAFLIADVSGKGIPGALFMMAAKTEIENYLSTGMSPAEAIASANRRLCANNDAGMFVTVWAATLDYHTGELTYVNAGHNFPLLRRGRGGSWEWLKKKCGLFLGTFETAKYRQETLTLRPGDELLLYTDGVNEAFSANDEEYGNARLEAFLASHANMGPEKIVRALRADVAAWAEGAEQSDDITILGLEFGAVPEVTGGITVPATLEHLGEAVGVVSKELERRLCPAGVQRKVEVALEELLVNVCSYAYANQDEPGEVSVSYVYRADPRSITVELRDQGTPFDPIAHTDPSTPRSIDEMGIGGLGIMLVRKSMDDFAYERDGSSNVVAINKRW